MSDWPEPSTSNLSTPSPSNSGNSTPRPKRSKKKVLFFSGSSAPPSVSAESHRVPSWNTSSSSNSNSYTSLNSNDNNLKSIGLNLKSRCKICNELVSYPRGNVSSFTCDVCGSVIDLIDDGIETMNEMSFALLEFDLLSSSNSTEGLKEFIIIAFKSLKSLNKAFNSTSNLQPTFESINLFYNLILEQPELIDTLRSSVDTLLSRPGVFPDEIDSNWMLVLIECPLFLPHTTANSEERKWLVGRLIGSISNLSNSLHHIMVNYLSLGDYPTEKLNEKIEFVTAFTSSRISFALFENSNYEMVEHITDWGVISGCKVSTLLSTANSNTGFKVPLDAFYCTVMDSCDLNQLITFFQVWEENESNQFNLCQYPDILPLGVKIKLLAYDGRRQMEESARKVTRSAYYKNDYTLEKEQPYLSLKIRRNYLLNDSLHQIAEHKHELKKSLKIKFEEEEGVDMGGIRKEWLLLLCRKLFDTQFGMFNLNSTSQLSWFNPATFESLDEFYLVGSLIGLAIYNQVTLDVPLPSAVYKKLRSEPVTLSDLATFDLELATGFQSLLDFEGDVEEVFCRTFVGEYESFGETIQVDFIEGGSQIIVTKDNRQEYVKLYVDFLLNKSISSQYESFEKGFNDVTAGNALSLLKGSELELLSKGSSEALDLDSLQFTTTYDGFPFNSGNPTIELFWLTISKFSINQQKKLLHFITGSDRVPAIGINDLKIIISNYGKDVEGKFPTSKTCFNQLCLYEYETEERMNYMLNRAMDESEGFGLH